MKDSKSITVCQVPGKLPPNGCRPVVETLPRVRCRTAQGGGAPTLNELVKEFLGEYEERFTEDRKSYEDMSVPDAIKRACFAERADGKRESHQCLVQLKALRAGYAALAAQTWAGLTFDELHSQVLSITEKIYGLGELYAYDTAVRLGHIHKVAPEKVYLHSGTRQGAIALGYRGRRSLEMSELPKPLRRLKPWQAEDFLCIYKKQLRAFWEKRN